MVLGCYISVLLDITCSILGLDYYIYMATQALWIISIVHYPDPSCDDKRPHDLFHFLNHRSGT